MAGRGVDILLGGNPSSLAEEVLQRQRIEPDEATPEQLAEARDKGDFTSIVGLEKSHAFNLSGHVLHSLFWTNLSPDGGGKPKGELAAALDENFGSFDAFKAQLTSATTTVQGSGWSIRASRMVPWAAERWDSRRFICAVGNGPYPGWGPANGAKLVFTETVYLIKRVRQ